MPRVSGVIFLDSRALSRNAETKDFARPTSHPVRGWTGKSKAFSSPGTQNGRPVIKVHEQPLGPLDAAFQGKLSSCMVTGLVMPTNFI